MPHLLLALVLGARASAVELPPPADDAPEVTISPALRLPAFEMSPELHEALRLRQWDAATAMLLKLDPAKLVGAHKGDWAFLLAYTSAHSGHPEAALPYLDLLDGADCVPRAYSALVKGETLRALKQPQPALDALDHVEPGSSAYPRAMVDRAEILRELGNTSEAWKIYEDLAALPDPSTGTSIALLALAQRAGAGNPDAYAPLRRIWYAYPHSDEAVEATKLLGSYTTPPTWEEVGKRAENLMNDSDFAGAILETDRVLGQVTGPSLEACRFTYARGRSFWRTNQITKSMATFKLGEARCKGIADLDHLDYGAKILYLLGQGQFKTKDFAGSAATNLKIPELYPQSPFADDGFTQAGFALTQAGDLEGARKVWTRAMDEQPGGDTVPEAAFRLAFTLYREGKPDEARTVAQRLGALPIQADAVDVAAGRYWTARLALYPDVANPNVPVDDPVRKQEAIDGWKALCQEMPHSFYAILAWSRLKELAPDVADELAKRPADFDIGTVDDPWVVRAAFLDHPAVRTGIDLARLGLIQEARAEWSVIDEENLTGDETALLTELRILDGDWLLAHDDMRHWIVTHPAGTLGPRQAQVLRVAYPDRYWTEVQQAATGYRYEPRLFHALCREESNFNVNIVSHAGAIGLSQLMPYTARDVGSWMGLTVTTSQLNDPALNAKLGARYLDQMHKQLGGSPYLSLAAYNAGAGRVNEWLGQFGNVPTDEYIEMIPFRETRNYVRRVMGSWQTYRYQFDRGPEFYDLSAYNRAAMKEGT